MGQQALIACPGACALHLYTQYAGLGGQPPAISLRVGQQQQQQQSTAARPCFEVCHTCLLRVHATNGGPGVSKGGGAW